MEFGKTEATARLIVAGRFLLAQGDTKFTVARVCAEARVSVDEFRRSFGNKTALFNAMLEIHEPEPERPPVEDMRVENRLRDFEQGLKRFEARVENTRNRHALGMARLEEKLEEIGRQISPAMREQPAPRSMAEHSQKETPDPIPELREALSKSGEHARNAPALPERPGPPRALILAIFVTLASLAGAVLVHGARGKISERVALNSSASVDQMTLLTRRAESGDANAQSQLAFAYLRGEGVERDSAAAVQWSRKAAASGQPEAEYLLGSLVQSGSGTSRDPAQAFMWFQRSADAGNVKAMHNLAIAYIQGNGTPKDATMAATWFARAAAAGYVDSAFDLAVLYEQGLGVRQDEQQALHWYRVAANAGDRTAARRARMLETAGRP